jgi:hypothetical protein
MVLAAGMLVAGIGAALAQNNNGYPQGYYNNGYGQRTTTVTVTNRGQNGYPDQVVQQTVACGSQYYDGYRQRIARC